MSSSSLQQLTIKAASETKGVRYDQETTATFDVTIKAPSEASEEHSNRKPVDIVCVIDKSGSMNGTPMTLVKETLNFMISQLKDGDRIAVVTFGDDAQVALSLTNMDDTGKKTATDHISKISADGWTALSAGIELGIKQLLQSQHQSTSKSVSSVLVFTDGQANRGITDVSALVTKTKNELDGFGGPVSLHTFGFSANHNPGLLTKLSEGGNGVFYYIPSTEKIPEVFADCLGGLLSVVALNVTMDAQVEYTGATITQAHTAFPVTTIAAGTHISIKVGQMFSEQIRDILFDVKLPKVDAPDLDVKIIKLTIKYLNRNEEQTEVTAFAISDRVAFDNPALKEINADVAEQKMRIVTADALKAALEFKAKGDMKSAKAKLASARDTASNRGYEKYAEQLQTADSEIDSSNDGYLWTNMRSHAYQQSVASAGPSFSGYSNAIQAKMKTESADYHIKKATKPSSTGSTPAVSVNIQAPQQQQQELQ